MPEVNNANEAIRALSARRRRFPMVSPLDYSVNGIARSDTGRKHVETSAATTVEAPNRNLPTPGDIALKTTAVSTAAVRVELLCLSPEAIVKLSVPSSIAISGEPWLR